MTESPMAVMSRPRCRAGIRPAGPGPAAPGRAATGRAAPGAAPGRAVPGGAALRWADGLVPAGPLAVRAAPGRLAPAAAARLPVSRALAEARLAALILAPAASCCCSVCPRGE